MVQEGKLDLNPGAVADTVPLISADSVAEPHYALVLSPPAAPQTLTPRETAGNGLSFILLGLFVLFLVVALRFRSNMKYVASLFHNLIDTRTRNNVFDDTVRETSLIVLLNILWCACCGIIGFYCFSYFINPLEIYSGATSGILIGMATAAAYTCFMSLSYLAVGWVFSDFDHARIWLKGFGASQALMSPLFFIIALLAVCWPFSQLGTAIIAISVFFIAKLLFIWKGFKIFFSQFSSWVLFLCYLCSLEIVPLVLICRWASLLEGTM